MKLFDYLGAISLKHEHFDIETEHLIEGFLPKQMISVWYADGGSGKSYLAYGVVKKLLEHTTLKVVYLDQDNPINILKERNINTLLVNAYPNLVYLHRSTMNILPDELIVELGRRAVGDEYKDVVFVIDSLKDILLDMQNDQKVNRTMNILMNMREAGATILILHHTNKDGKNYQGSNQIRNGVDVMYRLHKKSANVGTIHYAMIVEKERAGVVDSYWRLDVTTLHLTPMDKDSANMDKDEELFVANVCALLKGGEKSQKDLLAMLGFRPDDKTAKALLHKFDGKFYASKEMTSMRGSPKIFSTLNTSNTFNSKEGVKND